MPNDSSEYQIPPNLHHNDTEVVTQPGQPVGLFTVDNPPSYSIDRTAEDYGRRAAIAIETAELNTELEVILSIGETITAGRKRALEIFESTERPGFAKRFFGSLVKGQFDATSLGIGGLSRSNLAGDYHRTLINNESRTGASLLSVPDGVGRQEFFLSDSHPNEWFYHAQSLTNPDKSTTIRYVVNINDGVYKSNDGGQYIKLNTDELSSFMNLTKSYGAHLMDGPYKKTSRSDFGLAA